MTQIFDPLRSELAKAEAAYEKLDSDYTTAADLIVDLRDDLATARAVADSLNERLVISEQALARVTAEFEAYRTANPPKVLPVLFGADAAGYPREVGRPGPVPGGYETDEQAYRRIDPALGGLDFVRWWPGMDANVWSRMPAFWRQGLHQMPNLGSGAAWVAAVNRGEYDAALERVAQTAPAGVRTYGTGGHEPENDGILPADWAKAQRRCAQRFASVGRAEVQWSPVLMNSTFLPGRYRDGMPNNQLAPAWLDPIGTDVPWVLGIDVYQWGKPDQPTRVDTAGNLMGPAIAYAKAAGRKIIVPEIGARGTLSDAQRAVFLDGVHNLIAENPGLFEAVSYYESSRGSIGPWNITPSYPLATEAWKRMRTVNP